VISSLRSSRLQIAKTKLSGWARRKSKSMGKPSMNRGMQTCLSREKPGLRTRGQVMRAVPGRKGSDLKTEPGTLVD
jgi:hypothetical protein